MSVLGGLLLIAGILQGRQYQDWSVAQVAFFSLAMCAAIGGLVWLIYAPPHTPAGYNEMFVTLQNLNLQGENWSSKAIEIGMDGFLTINPVIKFIVLQAIGTLPMLTTIILVLYTQIGLAKAVLSNEKGSFSIYVLIATPIIAFVSALFLGVIG